MGIRTLATSFERVQRAEGRSPWTRKLYQDCIRRLAVFAEAETGSDDLAGLTRRLLTDFYAARAETCARSTVWTDWKVHRVYLKWLVSEDEMAVNPMDRMKAPRQTSNPVPVLSDESLRALVAACEGSGYRDRRDMALVRLLIDCGLRRTELCSICIGDLDLDHALLTVTGKTKTRTVAFGSKSSVALDRWLRVRGRRTDADGSDLLWRGLTPSGLYQALRGRAESAGIKDWHPHQMRHTFAHQWLAARGGETDLMQITGWSSVSMLRRYGASAASERARAAQRRLALGDRF